MKFIATVIGLTLIFTQAGHSQDEFIRPDDLYYYVNGVAADDVLNIRSKPSHKSKIIGSFPYNKSIIKL
jgi:uncharacterized protein YgiM (DUF1202 family)